MSEACPGKLSDSSGLQANADQQISKLISASWFIGKARDYVGRSVVQELAKDVRLEFPGVAGSAPNPYKIR